MSNPLLDEFCRRNNWLHARDDLPSERIRRRSDQWTEEQRANVTRAYRIKIAVQEKARAQAFLDSVFKREPSESTTTDKKEETP